MKKCISFLLFVFTMSVSNAQNIDNLFNCKYKHYVISSEFPNLDVQKDSINYLLVSIHKGINLDAFLKKTKLSKEKTDSIIRLLIEHNWLQTEGSKLKPTIFIATEDDGFELFEKARPISEEISNKIIEVLPNIKNLFYETEISKYYEFKEWSFMILSNVLLDNWQINNVENKFLNAKNRPSRGKKEYYAAILESNHDREPFNIYGNSGGVISIYGNNRNKANKNTNYRVSQKDKKIFNEMANSFLPDLMGVLENKREYIENIYKTSKYHNTITFNEFFIWWYHFIYTQATDNLNNSGFLTIPNDGNFVYKIEY